MQTNKPLRGAQLNKNHPLNRGLVGFWLFNEGDGKKALDLSGNGNHGTLENMAFPSTAASGWNAGRKGGALSFDGSNDYVDCGNDASLDIITEITLEAWIYPTTTGTMEVFDKADSGTAYRSYINANSKGFQWYVSIGGTFQPIQSDRGVLPANTWYHIVLTHNGTNQVMYINNVVEATTSHSGNLLSEPTSAFLIGSWRGIATYFNGQIDQVRIYNRALSAEEIKQLYLYPYAGFQQPCEAWLYAAAAGGLSIPVAMHHYRGLRA